jgi:hypothetical protein
VAAVSTVVNPIGPEEPAPYWRRRLLIGLGALVVLIVLFLVLRSCGADTTPTAAPSSAQPSASVSVSTADPAETAKTGVGCADTDIEVTVETDKGTSFPAGSPITFTMSIKNVSDSACDRNVGTKPNTVLVEMSGERVWSSDDCAPAGQDNIKSINPGDAYQLNATWDQKLSQVGCPAGEPTAKSGRYDVTGINDEVKSTSVPFTIS